jgi:GT2 family glycosyltransferase
VSVVIPSRGGAARLPVLLRALESQTEPDFEVIVVVDGDIDETAEMLARDWPRVRVVAFPTNRGRSTALSTGFAQARGEVLVRADDDFEPGPGYIAAHLAAHAAGPGGAIGMCSNAFPDNTYARAYGRAADIQLRASALAAEPEDTWRFWGGNVSVPREIYAEIGPYDTDYVRYGYEDIDWGWRLHEAGYPIRVRPELEVIHHVAATTAVIRARRAFLSGAARRLFESKHPGADLFPAAGWTPWGVLVALAAWRGTERRAAALGAMADRVARVAPSAIGCKVIALCVESAGRAGYAEATRSASATVGSSPSATGSTR